MVGGLVLYSAHRADELRVYSDHVARHHRDNLGSVIISIKALRGYRGVQSPTDGYREVQRGVNVYVKVNGYITVYAVAYKAYKTVGQACEDEGVLSRFEVATNLASSGRYA